MVIVSRRHVVSFHNGRLPITLHQAALSHIVVVVVVLVKDAGTPSSQINVNWLARWETTYQLFQTVLFSRCESCSRQNKKHCERHCVCYKWPPKHQQIKRPPPNALVVRGDKSWNKSERNCQLLSWQFSFKNAKRNRPSPEIVGHWHQKFAGFHGMNARRAFLVRHPRSANDEGVWEW